MMFLWLGKALLMGLSMMAAAPYSTLAVFLFGVAAFMDAAMALKHIECLCEEVEAGE